MTDYHRETGSPLTCFRTLLSNLNNMLKYYQQFSSDPNYAETYRLMQELQENLQKYKKTGSIVCKHCGRVERTHRFFYGSDCPGYEEK